MTTRSHIDLTSSLKSFSRAASLAAAVIGGLVLLSWAFDVAALARFFPGLGEMKANAALAFVLSAASLWLLVSQSDTRLILVARLCAAIVVVLSVLTLAEYLLGRDFGFDQLLFKDLSAADESSPGRMAPATAIMFLLVGAELSMLGAGANPRLIQSVALATGVVSLVGLAGYLYGIPSLYAIGPHAAPAPHTALNFLILSLGVLCARPGTGLLATATSGNVGGVPALRLLPAALGVPLVLGYLALLGQRAGLYEWQFSLVLLALANTAFFAVMILRHAHGLAETDFDRRKMEKQLQRDVERSRALNETSLAVASALELRQIFDLLLEKIEVLIPAATATIKLLNRESGELDSWASRNPNEEQWRAEEHRAFGGRAKRILDTKKPLTVRNLQRDPQTSDQKFYRSHGLVSYLGVPLAAKNQPLGVLGVYTKDEHEFAREEIEFLGALGGQAALAAYHAGIYHEAALSTKDLELANEGLKKSLKLLPGLYAALALLTPGESFQERLDGFIDSLVEATGADGALIWMWKKETGVSLVAGQRGFSDEHLKQVETVLLAGAVEWIVQHGEPIIAPDIAEEPRFKTKAQQQLGFRSSATAPLKIHNEVHGIIHLASRTPGHFDEEQRGLLVALAQQMSISMENRQLFENLKASRDELEKASKVKDEFLSVMSHELRTPLAVVMGYAGMVKEKMLGEINAKQEDALQKLLIRGNDQLNMINAIMQITQLESRALILDRHLLNVCDMLKHLKTEYSANYPKENVQVVWDYPAEPVAFVTDSGKLKEILVNLINNALKFTNQGTVTVALRLTEDHRRKWVELKVADTGCGIPKEQFPRIFDKFYQVDSSETRLYGGVGLGLYIVKHFTGFLGGEVSVESEPGKGSTFTIKIPYAT